MYSKDKEQLDINAEIKRLRSIGPQRVYLLYGEEDYLRDYYLSELKKMVFPDGEDDFSYKKILGTEPDVFEIKKSVDMLPFLSERTLIEIPELDINKYKSSDELSKIIDSLPDYCTLVFIMNPENQPDMRLRVCKRIKEKGIVLNFNAQQSDKLVNWIVKRFRAENKCISNNLAERLIEVSGDKMSGLIPEISKVCSYSKDDTITIRDIENAAHHIPEAYVFDMIDCLSSGNISKAAMLLDELLNTKDNDPIFFLALFSLQFKRLYAARIAIEYKLGTKFLVKNSYARFDSQADKLMKEVRRVSKDSIKFAIDKCIEADFLMKSSGNTDNKDLLKKTFAEISGVLARA